MPDIDFQGSFPLKMITKKPEEVGTKAAKRFPGGGRRSESKGDPAPLWDLLQCVLSGLIGGTRLG